MKIYIQTDLEGVAGVATWEECNPIRGDRGRWEEARRLLTLEVKVAVEAAVEAGAEEIIVSDGHRGGGNFVPELLAAGAKYVLGRGKPRPLPGLTEDFDGLMLLGYHCMANTPNGHLAHTQSREGWAHYWVNGVETGEIGQQAIMAGAFGVPVILVTGNASACREARSLLGEDLACVETQEDLSWESAISISPEDSRRRIWDAVHRVLADPPQRPPLVLERPIEIVLEFSTIEDLENTNVGGAERIGDRTVRVEVESPLDLLPRRW